MKTPNAKNWAGIFSLIWVLIGAGCFHYHAIRYNDYTFGPMWFFYLMVFAVWWGGGLTFALLASSRGSPWNVWSRRVAILLVCFYVFFIFIFIPRVHA
jgi:hypothetical protein